MKKRIVVVCPGRGTYNKEELGYLGKYHPQSLKDPNSFIRWMDRERESKWNQVSITALDQDTQWTGAKHAIGENASALIYACALADYLAIDRSQFEVAAVLGNSMGWYIALACAQSLSVEDGFNLINTMGSMGTLTGRGIVGGQILYPVMNEQWQPDAEKEALVRLIQSQINKEIPEALFDSIYFGGYRVMGGTEDAVRRALALLPQVDQRFPMRLQGHAAFHTPLLEDFSQEAFRRLPQDLFRKPLIPLVDGRGWVWNSYTTINEDLYSYTLAHQVVRPYDFTLSVEVALKEFAPDHIVILGPGTTLGGAVGQVLVKLKWQDIASKDDFLTRQASDNPIVLSLGQYQQRTRVIPS